MQTAHRPKRYLLARQFQLAGYARYCFAHSVQKQHMTHGGQHVIFRHVLVTLRSTCQSRFYNQSSRTLEYLPCVPVFLVCGAVLMWYFMEHKYMPVANIGKTRGFHH